MHAELTRTDALRPLIWPIALFFFGLASALTVGAPEWVLKALFAGLGVMLISYIGAYLYFAIKDPDALRSEKYKLQKMAIEQGLYGDSSTGLIDAGTVSMLEAPIANAEAQDV